MNYATATALLLAAYAAVILFFVIRGARSTKSLADFAVGSNGFPPVVMGLSLAASISSAATFIINPGFVAVYGWSAFLAMSIIMPIGLYISLVVLTKSFRKYGATVKAITLSQWMAKRYNSPGLGLWFALLSFLMITFIVLICVGMTKVVVQALGTPELPTLISLVVFIFGYMMFGGANSMVYTNAVQAVVKILVVFVLLTSGWEFFSEGISGFTQKLSAIDPLLIENFNPKSPLFRDWFEVLFCNFIIGIAIVCQPHIITRSLMLRRDEDVNKYLWVAIIVESIFFMVLFVGFFARLEFPDLTNNGAPLKLDGIVSAYVVKAFPVSLGLFVILGLISAGLATLEGLIQSVSTTLTNDLIKPILSRNKPATEEIEQKTLSNINKVVISILAMIAIVWSYDQLLHPNLSVGILAQNGVYAYFSAAFVPVLIGIYGKEVSKLVPIAASITAIITHFSVYYGQLTPYTTGAVRNPAVAGTVAIFAAVTVAGIVWLATKKK